MGQNRCAQFDQTLLYNGHSININKSTETSKQLFIDYLCYKTFKIKAKFKVKQLYRSLSTSKSGCLWQRRLYQVTSMLVPNVGDKCVRDNCGMLVTALIYNHKLQLLSPTSWIYHYHKLEVIINSIKVSALKTPLVTPSTQLLDNNYLSRSKLDSNPSNWAI